MDVGSLQNIIFEIFCPAASEIWYPWYAFFGLPWSHDLAKCENLPFLTQTCFASRPALFVCQLSLGHFPESACLLVQFGPLVRSTVLSKESLTHMQVELTYRLQPCIADSEWGQLGTSHKLAFFPKWPYIHDAYNRAVLCVMSLDIQIINVTFPSWAFPECWMWGRRPNGFAGLSLNDRTFLFLVNLLDKTVSVG